MSDHLVVLITAESAPQARQIADALVTGKLAACATLAPVTSIFTWAGAVQHADEVLLIVKTRAAVFEALVTAVKALHSYDVPEIIALPIVGGAPDYLAWVTAETGG